MNPLYLLQFACLIFMLINAFILAMTHLHVSWKNKRFERSLKFHSHFINAFACQLHDMKTIDDDFRFWETCFSDTKHAVGEIHRNLFYRKTLLFRKFQQLLGHFFYRCAFDSTDKSSSLAMSILVNKKCI